VGLANGGILAANDTYNHFNDWNIISLPYGSGDFHTGNNEFHFMSEQDKKEKDGSTTAGGAARTEQLRVDSYRLPGFAVAVLTLS
jgi:hypothetical protein